MVNLKEVLTKYPECLQNNIRLRATLSDLYPSQDCRAEIFLIMAAYDQGIVREIQDNTLDTAFIGRITDKLVSAFASKRDRAESIVALWCDAYGAGILKKPFSGAPIQLHADESNDSDPLQIDGSSSSGVPLTPNQYKAVHSDKKRIAVAAGPGTGKTRVLTERIVHLIKDEHIPENKILALSFSSKAATEMRQRLKDRIGIQAYKVNVRTFHSFGLQIIRSHCNLIGYRDDFGILTSTNRNNIIREVLADNRLPPKNLPDYAHKISLVKNGIPMRDPSIGNIVREYNAKRKKANMIDFDDMVGLSLKLLRGYPEIAEEFQTSYSHILIDEVQDLNAFQTEIIRTLLTDDLSLFIVGDDDQCIYEWRGAKPGYFRNISNNQDFEMFYLEDNFRSDNSIVNLSAELIGHNKDRISKKIRARKTGSTAKKGSLPKTMKSTQAYRFHSENAESKFIVSEIQKLTMSGYTYGDFAILIRENRQAESIKNELEKQSIPCDEQVPTDASYDDLLQVLYAIVDIHKNRAISRAINYPSRLMDQWLFSEVKDMLSIGSDTPTYQAFELIRKSGATFDYSDIFYSRFDLLTGIASKFKTMLAGEVLEELYSAYQKESLSIMKQNKAKLAHLKAMIDIAKEFDRAYAAATSTNSSPLKDFLEYITLSEQDSSADEVEVSAVKLMTCHKSKGLEFPVVFIPGVQVGIFPNEAHVRTREDMESERRLFYVSMTRAIDRLYLTCNSDPFIGKGFVEKGFLAEIPEITISGV